MRMRPRLLAMPIALGALGACTGDVPARPAGGADAAPRRDGGPPPPGVDGGASPADAVDEDSADLVFCVDETNRYRATRSRPPLARSAALEAYAAEGAQVDGTAHSAHRHFSQTGGGGIACRRRVEHGVGGQSVAQRSALNDCEAPRRLGFKELE